MKETTTYDIQIDDLESATARELVAIGPRRGLRIGVHPVVILLCELVVVAARAYTDGPYETFLDRFSSGTMLTEFEAERMFAWLHGLLDELPEKDKMVFVLREMEGMDYSEIASTMETTELAVRIRVSRSRKKLLKSLRGMIATIER